MIIFLAFLALTATASCDAFQVSPLRPRTAPSRVLASRAPSSAKKILFQNLPKPTPSLLRQRMLKDDAEGFDSPLSEINQPSRHSGDGENAVAKFGSTLKLLKRALSPRLTAFFLALNIFVLPLFLPLPANAVHSGGRMGGSFGCGSGRSYSSRSYSAPRSSSYSRGYSRGYSSGYYSRPNVIVSPGIRPFYR